MDEQDTYWKTIGRQFWKKKLGKLAFFVVAFYVLVAIYAPFLASSKPLFVVYDGETYFPLFRYLFYSGFYSKRIDLFFNVLIFTFPLALLIIVLFRGKAVRRGLIAVLFLQFLLFFMVAFNGMKDPAADRELSHALQQAITAKSVSQPHFAPLREPLTWEFELNHKTAYAKLNMLLRYIVRKEQHEKLEKVHQETHLPLASLWQLERENERKNIFYQQEIMERYQSTYDRDFATFQEMVARCEKQECKDHAVSQWKSLRRELSAYLNARSKISYIDQKNHWLEEESYKISYSLWPLLRHFHWEDDAGGQQAMNQWVPWWDLTRVNRKDLLSALLFGARISLVVGISAVLLALAIGVPIGALAGYFGGRFDIILCRLLEIWESMPTFFMLLLIVAFTQSKSIFLVIAVIGFFGWTSFSRYTRGETLKQRNLPYIEACQSLGFSNPYIIFNHVLPNAIPPVLTLLPFAMMAAISTEAGLSFLGLGEEGSCSWGVLMDEGRSAFPAESYLLWPPAILLTVLLIAIALIGDALRDAFDPKLRQ